LHPMERIAAEWRTKVLIDGETFSNATYHWEGEILGAVCLAKPKRGAKPIKLYKINAKRAAAQEDEWMYQLENMGDSLQDGSDKEKAALVAEKLKNLGPIEELIKTDRDEAVVWSVAEVGLQPI